MLPLPLAAILRIERHAFFDLATLSIFRHA